MRRQLRKRSWRWKSQIAADDDGARLVNCATGATDWQLRWSEVNAIVAWKIDLITTDLICLGFYTGPDPPHCVCNEEQQGWNVMQRTLVRQFGIDAGWSLDVALPAFETNLTLLWSRQHLVSTEGHGAGLREGR
jgi:hypothetical protein